MYLLPYGNLVFDIGRANVAAFEKSFWHGAGQMRDEAEILAIFGFGDFEAHLAGKACIGQTSQTVICYRVSQHMAIFYLTVWRAAGELELGAKAYFERSKLLHDRSPVVESDVGRFSFFQGTACNDPPHSGSAVGTQAQGVGPIGGQAVPQCVSHGAQG